MQKLNIFYWLILPVLLFSSYVLIEKLNLSHQEYFGFAENKQSEINLDKDVVVRKILVKTGDSIKKGQLLMQVDNPDMVQELNQISISMGGLKIKNDITAAELKSEILKLEKARDLEINSLQTRINKIIQDDEFYKSLVNMQSKQKEVFESPNEVLLQNLKRELSEVRSNYDKNILHFKNMLSQPKETVTAQNQYAGKNEYLNSEREKFNIVAPFDGTIGSINVREGENVKSFASLITFYESTPPLVIGYVQEKYDLKINVGDSVYITSMYNQKKKVKGMISAKGKRIIEIPEKFRKIPDVKLYGIEVFINIPIDNAFLQKEVLRISENPWK
jgi:multidrug resistance efflux pump